MHAAAEGDENLPTGHLTQANSDVLPVCSLYFPAAQTLHAASDNDSALYDPGSQGVTPLRPFPVYPLSARHMLTAVEPSGLELCAGQAVHAAVEGDASL